MKKKSILILGLMLMIWSIFVGCDKNITQLTENPIKEIIEETKEIETTALFENKEINNINETEINNSVIIDNEKLLNNNENVKGENNMASKVYFTKEITPDSLVKI